MAILPRPLGVVAVAVLIFAIAISAVQATTLPPGPAPAPSHSGTDGTTLDQGIACVLMLLALVLTYLIHSADVPNF